MIRQHRKWLGKQIPTMEHQIEETIQADAEMNRKSERIQSVKRLGRVCAATLLAVLPEIGTLTHNLYPSGN